MLTAGIICEYNPFHNGHLYHIAETKKHADAVVCVMSGSFVQRGFPALCDKFARADDAVSCGADIVIELPTVFALSSAENFAFGGVFLLNALGFVNFISFGAESENITIVNEEDESFVRVFKKELSRGVSYAKAKANAAKEVFGKTLSDKPNDILAAEYIKSIGKLHSEIKPLVIKREFNDYHAKKPSGKYASASYIRKNLETAEAFMPRKLDFSTLADFEKYKLAALSHLRTVEASRLKNTIGCSEGLENRIKTAANEAESFDEFLRFSETKRYTSGRILRLTACSMLGIEKDIFTPEYIRILSLSKLGCELLRKNSPQLPVITNLSKQQFPSRQLELDIKATSLRALFSNSPRGNSDFRRSPRVINREALEYN